MREHSIPTGSKSALGHTNAGICPHCGYDVRDCPSRVCPECGRDFTDGGVAVRRQRIMLFMWMVALWVSGTASLPAIFNLFLPEGGFVEVFQLCALTACICVFMFLRRTPESIGRMTSAARIGLIVLSFLCWGPFGWLAPLILLPVFPVAVPLLIATLLWMFRIEDKPRQRRKV